jgi:hypothetical protein
VIFVFCGHLIIYHLEYQKSFKSLRWVVAVAWQGAFYMQNNVGMIISSLSERQKHEDQKDFKTHENADDTCRQMLEIRLMNSSPLI